MLDPVIQRRLENFSELPSIPAVISQVLKALDNSDISASSLAAIIERDQTLTARVLRVANSPFYGFSRKIATIDLAIVVMGLNTIKEIVLSLIIQRYFTKVGKNVFDVNLFWHYSVFCGSASRYLARKLKYRLAGEAFVAGLMHDLGILVIIEVFRSSWIKIKELQKIKNMDLITAENAVLNCTHADIGAWVAEKWNLPDKLCAAIHNHHTSFKSLNGNKEFNSDSLDFSEEISQPLTAIVSMAEWFAEIMEFKKWDQSPNRPELYLSEEVFGNIYEDGLYDPNSAFEILKQEILSEYQKASVFTEIPAKSLY
ncbi:MAG: HDOD domain-containing protein [Candidatus Kapaibacterium sp.]